MAKKKERLRPKMEDFEELSDRAYNVVSGSAIETVDELADHYPDDKDGGIRKIRGVGNKIFVELTAFLKSHGKEWKQRKNKK